MKTTTAKNVQAAATAEDDGDPATLALASTRQVGVFVLRCTLVLALGGLFLHQACTSLTKYLNFDTVTSFKTLIENSQPFPSVSLCPLETR